MSPKQPSLFLRSWYKWKALRLPWRKRFLVGLDLQGNTYWEFRELRGDDPAGRWRRIVRYPRSTHLADVRPSPQWHQWLRHLRDAPPTLQEQRDDLLRRQRTRYLAAEADARWDAKPRLVDDVPAPGRPVAALEGMAAATRAEGGGGGGGEAPAGETKGGAVASGEEEPLAQGERPAAPKQADPWNQHRRTGPSEDWQPQAWTPPASKR